LETQTWVVSAMIDFDAFVSDFDRTGSVSIIDRPGTDVLAHMPVVRFAGGVAISEPLVPRGRSEDVLFGKPEPVETLLGTALRKFSIARGFEVYQSTGSIKEGLRANDWLSGSTVSTEAGRRGSSHRPAEARLMAYLEYRQIAGGPAAVALDEVLPRYLRLCGISAQPAVVDFVMSRLGPRKCVDLPSVEEFAKDVTDAVRSPGWSEREAWKWADVDAIAGSFLRGLRQGNDDHVLARADNAICDGASAPTVLKSLFTGKNDGLESVFLAYNFLSLLHFERSPEAWEATLVEEIVARASTIGLAASVEATRRLDALVAAAGDVNEAVGSVTGPDRAPLPIGFERIWVDFGLGSISLPGTVAAIDLPLRQLVAIEVCDLALREAVGKAREDHTASMARGERSPGPVRGC
jgi:hypothetical protein